ESPLPCCRSPRQSQAPGWISRPWACRRAGSRSGERGRCPGLRPAPVAGWRAARLRERSDAWPSPRAASRVAARSRSPHADRQSCRTSDPLFGPLLAPAPTFLLKRHLRGGSVIGGAGVLGAIGPALRVCLLGRLQRSLDGVAVATD